MLNEGVQGMNSDAEIFGLCFGSVVELVNDVKAVATGRDVGTARATTDVDLAAMSLDNAVHTMYRSSLLSLASSFAFHTNATSALTAITPVAASATIEPGKPRTAQAV